MKLRLLLLALLIPLGLPLLVWVLHPWPVLLRWKDPGTTAYIEFRLREAASEGEVLEIRREWIPLEEMPGDLIRAVTMAEDDRFREHAGVDWNALAEEVRYRGPIPPRLGEAEDREALWEAWRYLREHRDRVRGRSTLTQQLARNLYLSPDRSMVRKAQELLIARRLEFFLSKDRILELYLNSVELGPGVFGVEAASQVYFQRSARELTRTQAASLAATLPHPLTSNPATSPGRMAWRRDLILDRMAGGARPVPPPEAPDPVGVPVPDPLPDPGEGLPDPIEEPPVPDWPPEGDSLPPPPDSVGKEPPASDTLPMAPTPGAGEPGEPAATESWKAVEEGQSERGGGRQNLSGRRTSTSVVHATMA
jgi:monofunctional glycosyltransferase